jgi:hypothetical protein
MYLFLQKAQARWILENITSAKNNFQKFFQFLTANLLVLPILVQWVFQNEL